METNLNKPDYFNVGTREDIVVSNSSLSYINPEQGGSPQKFLSFFDKQEEKQESKSLENGSIVHLYAEKPDEFAVADVAKPSGMSGSMADEFYRLRSQKYLPEGVSTNITSNLKTEGGKTSEILSTKAAFEKLSELLNFDLNSTIAYIRLARERTQSYTSYKEDTLVNKFIAECIDYLKQLDTLAGKIALTASQKGTIESCIKALKANELANKYFNLGGNFLDNVVIIKELDVYFELLGLRCKARLDNIYIDIFNGKIYINDLKTTAKPLSLFQETLEYYRYYRQLAFYVRALRWLIINKKLDYLNIKNLEHFDIIPQIIAVETVGNFDCDVFVLDTFYIEKGTKEVRSLLERVKFHKDSNNWNKSMESLQNNGVIKLTPKV